MHIHLTTEEVALAGVAVGGLIGSLSGSIRDRANERREHSTRLWEKEAEIYESLLVEALDSRQIRHDVRWKFSGFGDGKIEFPSGVLDEIAKKRLPIQLKIFGRPRVQEAHDECQRLLRETVVALAKVNNSLDDIEVGEGPFSEDQMAIREEAIKCKTDLLRVLDAGDEAEQHLTRVISDAVQRLPASGRKRARRMFNNRRLPTSDVKIDLTRDR